MNISHTTTAPTSTSVSSAKKAEAPSAVKTVAGSSKNLAYSAIEDSLQRDASRISSIGKLSSLLVEFQDKATAVSSNSLKAGFALSEREINAALEAGHAKIKGYTFENPAESQELLSPVVPSKSAPVITGDKATIQVDIGPPGTKAHSSISVTIDQSNNTLEGIAKALKDQGVNAEVVETPKGYQLHITGKSGTSNELHIGVTGDTALQALLSWPASDKGGMTKVEVAKDAPTAISNAKAFIDSVNELSAQIDTLKGDDDFSAELINRTKKQLGQAFAKIDQNALAAAGISLHGTTFTVDTKKLEAALDANPKEVGGLITGAKGISGVLAAEIGKELGSGGVVSKARTSTQEEMSNLTRQKEVITSMNRQASLAAQQYSNAGQGVYSQFGDTGTVRKMSLFEYI
ncbi:flagellar filament capping protein FliD [Massilia sp. 2TAF26]|uniref:flagellar filament capping protein FliD n=1 Tax=Massilia sp. 2TAF26 TaxID=3233012 RepID=UPI003F9D0E07